MRRAASPQLNGTARPELQPTDDVQLALALLRFASDRKVSKPALDAVKDHPDWCRGYALTEERPPEHLLAALGTWAKGTSARR